MEEIILFALVAESIFVLAGVLIAYRKWRPVLKAAKTAAVDLAQERIYGRAMANRVRAVEHELQTERMERMYWEKLTHTFEDEVMKIATGKSL